MERNTGNKHSIKLGFSKKQLPNKLSAKISDNLVSHPYGTPNKVGLGHITKSFEFTSEDSREQQDKVDHLNTSLQNATDKKS